jgi:hypothetical protein
VAVLSAVSHSIWPAARSFRERLTVSSLVGEVGLDGITELTEPRLAEGRELVYEGVDGMVSVVDGYF